MSIKGKKKYNNGIIAKFFSDDDIIPPGFVLGPLEAQKEHLKEISHNGKGKKKSQETKDKLSKLATMRYSCKENHPMYGKKHSEETKHKISETLIGRVAWNKNLSLTDEQKINIKNKHIDEYGSYENYVAEVTRKQQNTKLIKYGDKNFNNKDKTKETIKKIPNFYADRYEKSKSTKIERYGSVENASIVRKYNLAKSYGFDKLEDYNNYWRNNILKNVNNKRSSLEKRLAEFLHNNSIIYTNGYTLKNEEISHEFDFAVFDDNNSLVMLIDCDGMYYHSYLSDVNGKSVNNYSDEYRMLLVPSEVKFFVLLENNELECYNEILSIIGLDFSDYVEYVFNWCRESEFPFPKYNDKILTTSYSSLINADCDKFSINARFGEKVVLNFHESIWKCNKKNKPSPFSAWYDDTLLRSAITNRIIYKGTNLDKSRILYGLSTSGIAPRVSIFNPYLAKYLINKYLANYDTVFDPCCGYSGRLLGCTSLNKHYVGQDINAITVEESNKIKKLFNLDCELFVKDSCNTYAEYDCMFTCPPYSDKENWGMSIKNMSCDDWIDILINNYKCKTYLFVVDNTIKYADYVVETIQNRSHITSSNELVICINEDQYKLLDDDMKEL